ncbi:hypothetical protein QE152_g4980 [Popillia japonica]|uniref:Uncharacterized protein n=1 Tax=Popillia japonica TaxID=7064 RepID=A0AAW1MZ35_POPJA
MNFVSRSFVGFLSLARYVRITVTIVNTEYELCLPSQSQHSVYAGGAQQGQKLKVPFYVELYRLLHIMLDVKVGAQNGCGILVTYHAESFNVRREGGRSEWMWYPCHVPC